MHMSLITVLDRIMNWLINDQPDYADSFLPGLSRQEIDSICSAIPGCLSDDIYQLYQWRNGTCEEYWKSMRAFHLHYQPLEEVIESALGLSDDFEGIKNTPFTYNDSYLLPFCTIEKDLLCTLIFNEPRQFSPVVVANETGVSQAFFSLTSMLEMYAEGLENGIYHLNDNNEIDGNKNDIRTLFYKYNPPNMNLIFW